MKVFAYEYASGGGPVDARWQNPLTYQGEMMLRALISDLAAVPGIEVITTRGWHLPALELPASIVVVPCERAFSQCFNDCVQAADAVWPVAPESAGILARLSLRILRRKRVLLGSKPAAVLMASSKLLTARKLAKAGIAVVDTYSPDENLPEQVSAWVVKPDDGLGCVETRIFHGRHRALAWLKAYGGHGYVLQPFISGKPCSLCMLCCDGAARVLSCNEQRIAVRNNQFHFLGSTVNRITDCADECGRLARSIAKAMPGLWGYVGVDFIMTGNGAVVLEVNPRLTTSYTGLHASIGCNPAGLVLSLLQGLIDADRHVFTTLAVSVDTDAFSVH
jgi:predicted ATP-grasp superfamily ATP-dependent carboligase